MPLLKQKYQKDTFYHQPYCVTGVNIIAKTMSISFIVSLAQQPFNFGIVGLSRNGFANLRLSMCRGMFKGITPNIISGQKRGAVAISAKQAGKRQEEELLIQQKILSAFIFGQCDLLLSQSWANLSKLQLADIVTPSNALKWSAQNYYKLSTVNWGSRSVASLINFSAIGFVGDACADLFSFNNVLLNKLLGGGMAGVFACMLTQPFNAYSDYKLLSSTVEPRTGRLLVQSPQTMFHLFKQKSATEGRRQLLKRLATHSVQEFCLRGPASALTFGLIHVLDAYIPNDAILKVVHAEDQMPKILPAK